MFFNLEGYQVVFATPSFDKKYCEYCKDSDKLSRDDYCQCYEVKQTFFVMVVAIAGTSVSTLPINTMYQIFFYSKEFIGECPKMLSVISDKEPYYTTSLCLSLNPFETGLSLRLRPECKHLTFNNYETSDKFSGLGSVNKYAKAFRKIWNDTIYAKPLTLTMDPNQNPHIKPKGKVKNVLKGKK